MTNRYSSTKQKIGVQISHRRKCVRNVNTQINGGYFPPLKLTFLQPFLGAVLLLLSTLSHTPAVQCFFSRNIGQVTPKNFFFYYLQKLFLD